MPITAKQLDSFTIFTKVALYLSYSECIFCSGNKKVFVVLIGGNKKLNYVTIRCLDCVQGSNYQILNEQEIFYLKCTNRI